MQDNYKNSNAYVTNFNPRKYLEAFYSTLTGSAQEGDMLPFLIQSKIELSSMLPGGLGKALDFGCGPVVIGLMPVVDKVDSILYADYVPANLKV